MPIRNYIGLLLCIFLPFGLTAQTDCLTSDTISIVDTTAPIDEPFEQTSRVKLRGYLKNLSTISIPYWKGDWYSDNLIHNRLNFKWNVSNRLILTLEARNRLFFGESIKNNPHYPRLITQSPDFWQTGGVIMQQRSFLIHSVVDRANLSWTKDNWQVVIGKQRINWSKSFVWNPNDLFNAYSFFDFDYEERRGTDAIRIKYNLGPLTSIEVASNADKHIEKMTMAMNYHFNKNAYDFQLLLGKYQTDLAIGGGWAGQIKGAGFKGEVSYFQPYQTDTVRGTLLGDISLDYTFPSTLTFRLEAIANSNPVKENGLLFLTQPVTAKTLTFNHLSAFASVGYDITPLIKGNVGSILNVDDESFFVNPALTFSLNDNTEVLLAAQVFSGRKDSLFYGMGSYVFTRLKWSF